MTRYHARPASRLASCPPSNRPGYGQPAQAAVRAPYGLLAAAAVASLPVWARWPLRLPYLPLAEATVVRLAGDGLVRSIRWVLVPTTEAAA